MEPLFLGGHPAIDFLNTYLVPRGKPIELIGDGRSYLQWLVLAGLLDSSAARGLERRLGGEALDATADEARRFREWVRAWLARTQGPPGDDDRSELRRLNRALKGEMVHREVIATPDGYEVIERNRIDALSQLLALVAVQIARLISDEDLVRVKRCAGSDCTLWFLDRTKAGRRMFCSAAVCGNRAKVAAYRERHRVRPPK